MAERTLPKHITIPNWDAYQVRIVRDGEEHSSSFAWSAYPRMEDALVAAVAWRVKMLANLPPEVPVRTVPLSHKKSWARAGVTRYERKDARRAGNPRYLTFGVNWVDGAGVRRTKSFQAGNVEEIGWADELHAANTAEAFRSEYEWCRLNGHPFQDDRYNQWKTRVCYPFLPPVADALKQAAF